MRDQEDVNVTSEVKDIYKHVGQPLLQRVSTKQTLVIVGTRI